MTNIKITKGLDIPIIGKPYGDIKLLQPAGEASPIAKPLCVALDLKPFHYIKFKLLIKVGDVVKIGQPIVEDKIYGRKFVSPAAGIIKNINRGEKRILLNIVIEIVKHEEYFDNETFDVESLSSEKLFKIFKYTGMFAHIHSRPFGMLANPTKIPRCIFIKAIASAFCNPPAELQVQDNENAFQIGLTALSKITPGNVHLVFRKDTLCNAFNEAKHVQKHTAEGPHPIANQSVHIQAIDPIKSADDNIWTLNVLDVIKIGNQLLTGHYFTDRIIGIGGPGIIPDKVGYFKVRDGYPIKLLLAGRIDKRSTRLISGDLLMGQQVKEDDFLGYKHFAFCGLPENNYREFLHFFRLGTEKYTYSQAYMTGHFNNHNRGYSFSTNQHGEHRPFIDGSLYDRVNPLHVPIIPLVKASMAEDYDLAQTLGLLDVDPEDFALPTFVCPSKIDMTEIIDKALKVVAKENIEV